MSIPRARHRRGDWTQRSAHGSKSYTLIVHRPWHAHGYFVAFGCSAGPNATPRLPDIPSLE
eukprot:4037698-Pyramimonas_sp.AAC.1